MDISHKDIAIIFERAEEVWIFAVTGIQANPGKTDSLCSSIARHFKDKLALGFELNVVWDTRFLTAFLVVSPLLCEIQTLVNQCYMRTH